MKIIEFGGCTLKIFSLSWTPQKCICLYQLSLQSSQNYFHDLLTLACEPMNIIMLRMKETTNLKNKSAYIYPTVSKQANHNHQVGKPSYWKEPSKCVCWISMVVITVYRSCSQLRICEEYGGGLMPWGYVTGHSVGLNWEQTKLEQLFWVQHISDCFQIAPNMADPVLTGGGASLTSVDNGLKFRAGCILQIRKLWM